jgi:hypothetical protein
MNRMKTYLHPSAAAIAADPATAAFAQICAVRALMDTLDGTSLNGEGARMAVASLLNELGTVAEVERAIADVRRQKLARISLDAGVQVMTKALHLAAHHAIEGKVLPPEGIDFLKYASQLADKILPGAALPASVLVTDAVNLRMANANCHYVPYSETASRPEAQ